MYVLLQRACMFNLPARRFTVTYLQTTYILEHTADYVSSDITLAIRTQRMHGADGGGGIILMD